MGKNYFVLDVLSLMSMWNIHVAMLAAILIYKDKLKEEDIC